MKALAASAAIVFAVAMNALPAAAAQFVQDGAGMFASATVSQLDTEIGNFQAQTGKEIVVVTVPSLNGETLQNAAQTVFGEQNINGVLIFIAKGDRKDIIVPGRTTAQFFPASTTSSIRTQMESSFRDGDVDGGITTAVSSILDVFRSHLNSAPGYANGYGRSYPAPVYQRPVATRNGIHLSMFWWIILIIIGFLVIRSIFRAMSGPRYYGGPGGGPMGGPGYGPGPGYGGGYGGPGYYGGGGGGFWSGMLGGLGGAFLGNELFNRGGGGYVDPNVAGGGVVQGDQGGGWGGNAPDPGGWGNDAGQADMGSSSAGDWSGGGFGGGDFGGGGGGDFGGGGGDSGGGW
jgi:uncharacterized protein